MAVSDVAGPDDLELAGRHRYRGGPGVVAAGFSIGVAIRVVSELAQHPGADKKAQSRLAADDLGVRVLIKMVGQFGLEDRQLAAHLSDHSHSRLDGGTVCSGQD